MTDSAQAAADGIKARRAAERIQELIQKGVEYAIAEDKAFLAGDRLAEDRAITASRALVRELAAATGTDPAHATEAILTALTAQTEQGN